MVGYMIGAVILVYTGFVIYKKWKGVKAGKSCCSGCDSCSTKDKCKR